MILKLLKNKKLNKIGIRTVEDLLFHLPIRYQDKTKLTKISNLEPGNKYFRKVEKIFF